MPRQVCHREEDASTWCDVDVFRGHNDKIATFHHRAEAFDALRDRDQARHARLVIHFLSDTWPVRVISD